MKLTELFRKGKFVVTAELSPPKSVHAQSFLHEATELLRGVDAVNVTDNPSSVLRMSGLAVCAKLQSCGVNTVYQMTCRDKNRLALQSDLLGAAMLGVENILCLTGDHTRCGDHPGAKPVFDLDSVSLLHAASQLERGKDLGGSALVGEAPSFAKAAGLFPCSDSPEAQLSKMERKTRAGAEFFQSQAVFDARSFIRFMERAAFLGRPVQMGVILLQSAEMALWMQENLAGISVPEEYIRRLAADPQRAASGETGLEIACELIEACRPYCQGVHIMAAGREDLVSALLERSGLK